MLLEAPCAELGALAVGPLALRTRAATRRSGRSDLLCLRSVASRGAQIEP